MAEIIASILPYAVGAVGIIAALVGVFMRGRASAKRDIQLDNYDAMKGAQEVRRDVEAMDDDNLAAEFDRLREQRRR